MPLRIFNLNEAGDLVRTVSDMSIGTTVLPAEE